MHMLVLVLTALALTSFVFMPQSATQSVTLQISAAGDDVNQESGALVASGLYIGTGGDPSGSYIGFRFQQVSIPRGATISSAQLKVYSNSAQWITVGYQAAGVALGNVQPFSGSNLLSALPLTSFRANQNSSTQWLANTWYTLDQMAPAVQEIVSRGDWASGNAIAIVLHGTSSQWSRKFIQSYENNPTLAVQLVLTYSDSSVATPTSTAISTPTRTATSAPVLTNTPTRTATNTPIATSTATNTSTRTSTPTSTSALTNIVNDGGFELGNLSVWTVNAAVINTSSARSGTYDARLSGTSWVSQNIAARITAGTTYTITASTRITTAGTSWGSIRLALDKYSDCGATTYGATSAANNVATGWQTLTLRRSFTTSELANPVYMCVAGFGFTGGVADVDDIAASISGTPLPPMNTPIPGTATSTRTPTQTATQTNTPIPGTATNTPTRTSTPTSTIPPVTVTPSTGEWTQYAHDAQRTNYTDQVVTAPWRIAWTWNGPTANGGIGKVTTTGDIPQNVQPVTGGGRVYVAAGVDGVFALDNSNGSFTTGLGWKKSPGGNINSTVAYDAATNAVFVVSDNGTLYKLDAATGNTIGQFASTSGAHSFALPPAVISDRVFFAMGTAVYAIDKNTMAQMWKYDTGVEIQTPPSYSPSRNLVLVGGYDLYIYAVNNASGGMVWKSKPTNRISGDPSGTDAGTENNKAEIKWGHIALAEQHGLALVRYRLDYSALRLPFGDNASFPSTNEALQLGLANSANATIDYRDVFAINLDNGASPFFGNVVHSGWGDGGRLPMGSMPIVKSANGIEVAYVMFRGGQNPNSYNRFDYDGHFGEMVLDSTTVSGLLPGYVRWIQYGQYGWTSPNSVASNQPRDEEPFVTMAGNYLLGVHWSMGMTLQITDRSAAYGSFANPIRSTAIPSFVVSTNSANGVASFNASHYQATQFAQDGGCKDARIPFGFYLYYNQGCMFSAYDRGYGAWVSSNDTLYLAGIDGSIVAFKSGNPTAQAESFHLVSLTTPVESFGAIDNPRADDRPATGADVISYLDARNHIGQVKMVEGEIKQILNNGHAVYLGFQDPHQGVLVVRIMQEDWGRFADTPNLLYNIGQTIRVTGKITWYQGDPVIYVSEPGQIDVR
jgi:hypothetical protein